MINLHNISKLRHKLPRRNIFFYLTDNTIMNMQIFFREEIFRFTLSEMFFMLPGFVAFAARCL